MPIVTDVRSEQPRKALAPMLVTLLGMVIDVRPEHKSKARDSMVLTLLGILTDVTFLRGLNLD